MINPPKSWEQTLRDNAWTKFHSKLMELDEKALNLVIDSLDILIESVNDEQTLSKRTDELVRESYREGPYGVKKLDIQWHLLSYFRAGGNFEDKYLWNTACNLSRCLKRIRDDEAAYLLPKGDLESTLDLLDRLKHPPIKNISYL